MMEKTQIQELIEVLKVHRDTAHENAKVCEADAKTYYSSRGIAFSDAIKFAEIELRREEREKTNTSEQSSGCVENNKTRRYKHLHWVWRF